MRHCATFVILALAAWPLAAAAQSADLTAQQKHGRQILTQNCNVCHLPQNPGSATYGPRLSKSSTNGDDNLMRDAIKNGIVRMPAWKYTLSDSDINDIIAYVRTLPDPPAPAARGGGGAG
jgi:mono/diheme cytochrome c family protein